MELAIEFWSLPFQFLSNASANLLVLLSKSSLASLAHHGFPKELQIPWDCSPGLALLGLLSWACSPGLALWELLSWDCSPGIALMGLLSQDDCSPGVALLGLLSWDCSPGIALLGFPSRDCFPGDAHLGCSLILRFKFK